MKMQEEIVTLLTLNPTMSYKDMAIKLNCSKSTIQYHCNKLNICRDRIIQQKLNNTNRNKEICISKKAKEILIGTLLGDSHVSKYKRNGISKHILNSNISCGHSLKQREYAKYLVYILESENLHINYREDNKEHVSIINGREIKTFGRCDVSTCRNIIFNDWRDLWYPNNIKRIPREIINDFSELTLAIWFMDDGSKNNQSYYLHTEGFILEDIQFLQEILLEKFNIKTFIQKSKNKNVLYISRKSKSLFTKLILLYIIPSMEYKLWI